MTGNGMGHAGYGEDGESRFADSQELPASSAGAQVEAVSARQVSVQSRAWIKIGEHDDEAALAEEVLKLREQWPGRYQFVIVSQEETDPKRFVLYLKHC